MKLSVKVAIYTRIQELISTYNEFEVEDIEEEEYEFTKALDKISMFYSHKDDMYNDISRKE